MSEQNRDIPIKPIVVDYTGQVKLFTSEGTTDGGYVTITDYYCPICQKQIGFSRNDCIGNYIFNYCPHCGQKIENKGIIAYGEKV